METKHNGGQFRSTLSLENARETVYRLTVKLPVRTLELQGEILEPARKFNHENTMADLEAIFGN